MMGIMREKGRYLFLAAALLTAAALPAHKLFVHHSLDSDCQVCAISCSPQLNSDCGSVLLYAPVNFELFAPVFFIKPAAVEFSPAFQGRAPPIA